MSSQNIKPKFILAALVVLGLGFSGVALVNASDKTDADSSAVSEDVAQASAAIATAAGEQDDPVVAKVDGTDIKRSEVLGFINSLPPQLRQMPADNLYGLAVDQLISNHIVDRKAGAAKLNDDKEVKEMLAQAHDQIIRNVYLERQVAAQMSDKRLKESYDKIIKAMPDVEEVSARHILVDSEEKAKELLGKIKGGEAFEKLAEENTMDKGTAPNGGDLGYFAKNEMVAPFAEAAFAMKKGEVSKAPVKTDFGWHIIKVEDKRKRAKPAFDAVKPQLEQQARQEIMTELVGKWQKEAKVEKFDAEGKPVADSKAN